MTYEIEHKGYKVAFEKKRGIAVNFRMISSDFWASQKFDQTHEEIMGEIFDLADAK